jgi:hypothetical protein
MPAGSDSVRQSERVCSGATTDVQDSMAVAGLEQVVTHALVVLDLWQGVREIEEDGGTVGVGSADCVESKCIHGSLQ